MRRRLTSSFTLSFAAMLASCGAQKDEAGARSEARPQPTTEPAEAQPAETEAAAADEAAALETPDAAVEARPLAEGEHQLDLDGDGNPETIKVTTSHVELGELSIPHTLDSQRKRPVQPKTWVIDVDTSDSRKELLIRLSSYESLAYNVLVFMDKGELVVSKVLYVRDLEAVGDGHLKAVTWINADRRELLYKIKGKKVVVVKKTKKRTSK